MRVPRTAPLLGLPLLLSALLLLPASQAQMAGPLFQVAVAAPSEPVEPGNLTGIVLRAERLCPNPAAVLEQQEAALRFTGHQGGLVSGPAQVVFPQQVCAQQPVAHVEAPYVVEVPRDANGTLSFLATLQPTPTGPLHQSSPEVSAAFAIGVAGPAPASAFVPQAEEQQALPGPAFAVVSLAVLGAAAIALRHRT